MTAITTIKTRIPATEEGKKYAEALKEAYEKKNLPCRVDADEELIIVEGIRWTHCKEEGTQCD